MCVHTNCVPGMKRRPRECFKLGLLLLAFLARRRVSNLGNARARPLPTNMENIILQIKFAQGAFLARWV